MKEGALILFVFARYTCFALPKCVELKQEDRGIHFQGIRIRDSYGMDPVYFMNGLFTILKHNPSRTDSISIVCSGKIQGRQISTF